MHHTIGDVGGNATHALLGLALLHALRALTLHHLVLRRSSLLTTLLDHGDLVGDPLALGLAIALHHLVDVVGDPLALGLGRLLVALLDHGDLVRDPLALGLAIALHHLVDVVGDPLALGLGRLLVALLHHGDLIRDPLALLLDGRSLHEHSAQSARNKQSRKLDLHAGKGTKMR